MLRRQAAAIIFDTEISRPRRLGVACKYHAVVSLFCDLEARDDGVLRNFKVLKSSRTVDVDHAAASLNRTSCPPLWQFAPLDKALTLFVGVGRVTHGVKQGGPRDIAGRANKD